MIKMGLDQIRPKNVYIKPLPILNLMNMHGKLLNALQINDLMQRFLCTCIDVYISVRHLSSDSTKSELLEPFLIKIF
jgi:hypothetical protein